ncbi:MAG: LysM peptidoglycan-binding domain-containing protein [Campylobacterota bacterium]|nr:LysM peptidoglycan-binding domain-containing protein [Campylobacterota bacterium]
MSSIVVLTSASASEKRLVECRLVTPKTTECKPYPSKFMFTEKLTYDGSSDKLIISKTLPAGPKPKLIKVIKVEDMIENHLEVLGSVRFSGSQPSPLRKSAAEIRLEKAEKEQEMAEARLQIKKELAALKRERERLKLLLKQQEVAKLHADKIKETEAEKKKIAEEKKKAEKYAGYSVQSGDSLILIARRFKMSTKDVLAANSALTRKSTLKIGQKITIPLSQKKLDAILKKRKDQQLKEAKRGMFTKSLEKKYRQLKKKRRKGITLNEYDTKLFRALKSKHKLRVQATAYTSHGAQTDSTPFLAAWNNRIRPGMKIIAVSRDLITKYGLGNGKKVRIQGLPGYYTVRDKMNKRYTKRIDIYMGLNRRKALRWGRKRTVIYW